jgi:putative redox protein
MARDVRVSLTQKLQFVARTGSGHELLMDTSSATGGENAGPRPTEVQLAALGACTAMSVLSILRKMRMDVRAYDVDVHGEQAAEHPQAFTAITLSHRISGRDLREDDVRRAIELTVERYCPISTMLSATVPIRERYALVDDEGGATVSGEIAIGTLGS